MVNPCVTVATLVNFTFKEQGSYLFSFLKVSKYMHTKKRNKNSKWGTFYFIFMIYVTKIFFKCYFFVEIPKSILKSFTFN